MSKMRISQLEIRETKSLPLDIIHDILNDHYRRRQQNPLYLSVLRGNGFHHLSTYCNGNGGLAIVDNFSISDKGLPRFPSYRIQSCLGLVCVSSMFESIVFVCNPTTRERLLLPSTQRLNTCIGFGYAPSIKEFRVFMFYYHRKTICCKTIALGAPEWIEVNSPPFQTLPVCLGGAPFLHGDLQLLHCRDNEYSITAFHIETEEYRQVRVPADYHDDQCVHPVQKLLDIGGSLSLIGKRDKLLEIWLLKDYRSAKWVKEYTIDFSFVGPEYLFSTTVLEVLVDGCLMLTLERIWSNELLCYNPQYKTATQNLSYTNCSWGLFVESFRSLGSR